MYVQRLGNPLLSADSGGRVLSFEDTRELEETATVYEELGQGSGLGLLRVP
jgi:hypothetical protein